MKKLTVEKLRELIYPVGFYKVKAENLHKLATIIAQRYKGQVPETVEELKKVLPKKYWKELNQHIVTLGQTICRPMKHECEKCPLNKICPESKI